jgi:DNA adenine methylase
MPTTDSPLRYPGGKTQLAPFVIEVMRDNELFHGTYVEPFAGGAGIAWRLLFDNYVSEVWINDIDPAIHAFWSCVLQHTDDFCERIAKTKVTMKEWHRQREVQSHAEPSLMDLGFSTFFLNRTNRSGIIKGGVIGGLTQEGDYPLDCRFKKPDLIQRIRRIALYAEQIRLTRMDAETYLRTDVKKLGGRCLVNIDPPYYRKGPGLYCSFYEHHDHVSLAGAIRRVKQPWMLTYDDVPEIRTIYAANRSISKTLNYYAQIKRVGVELVVFSDSLLLPRERAAA